MDPNVISIFNNRAETADQLTIGDDRLAPQDDQPTIGDDRLAPQDDQPSIGDQDDDPVTVESQSRAIKEVSQSPPMGEDLLVPRVDQSAEPPSSIICGESQNQISSLKSTIMKLDRKYTSLLKNIQKEKERIRKKTSREILDKLSASHHENIQSQRKRFDEIISKTNQTHDSKVKSLSEFYEEILNSQHKKMEDYKVFLKENASLKKDNETLSLAVSVYKERLDNIQCLLTGEKPQSSPSTNQLPLRQNTPRQEPIMKQENDNINETIRQHERQIADLNALVEHLNTQIQMKETMINNMMFQINYYKDLKTNEEKERKKLEVDNAELAKNFENMQIRHSEQFKDYEKLLKRSRQEINVHKREIARLRHHYANFPSSPAAGRLLRLSNDLSSSTPDLRGTPTPTFTAAQSTSQRSQENLTSVVSPAPSYCSNPSDALSVMSPSAVTTVSDTMDSIRMTPTPTPTNASSKYGSSSKLKELTKSDFKSKTVSQSSKLKTITKLDIQQSETESNSCKTPVKTTNFSTPKKNNSKKTKSDAEASPTCITLSSTSSNTPAKLVALKTGKCPSSKKKTSKKDTESSDSMPADPQTESVVIEETRTPAKLGAFKAPKLTTSATKCSKNVTDSISLMSSPNTDSALSCVSLSSTSDKEISQSRTSGADTTPAKLTKRPRGRPRKNRSPR